MKSPFDPNRLYTHAEYLELERKSEIKHEFCNGRVYPLHEGPPLGPELHPDVWGPLQTRLRDRADVLLSRSLPVRVQVRGVTVVPDITIVRGEPERSGGDGAIVNPTVLVEVLEHATELEDRRTKCEHYRRIPSVAAYVLVSQHRPSIEMYQRADGGGWLYSEAVAGETVKLASIGCELSVDEVYANA